MDDNSANALRLTHTLCTIGDALLALQTVGIRWPAVDRAAPTVEAARAPLVGGAAA